jgi:hypothetical protein
MFLNENCCMPIFFFFFFLEIMLALRNRNNIKKLKSDNKKKSLSSKEDITKKWTLWIYLVPDTPGCWSVSMAWAPRLLVPLLSLIQALMSSGVYPTFLSGTGTISPFLSIKRHLSAALVSQYPWSKPFL